MQDQRNLAAELDNAIKAAGIPIHGVSIGNPEDKDTWRIDFTDDATEAQRTAAADILTNFE